jgi:cobalt/nickel transport system ATP-binding protein
LEPVIEIKNLEFSYPDGKLALDSINLSVNKGEKVAIVGANGAGKSTLLLHLNGILAGSGIIRINGDRCEKRNLNMIRSSVGVVFQNPDDQLFSINVYDDVAYGPRYQGLSNVVVDQRVRTALESVGMENYSSRNPYHLSGGEKKRVAIATVLSMQPNILVFDEPTAGLDPRARRELMDLMATLPQTLVIATHDMELVKRLTPRVVIMSQGRIVVDGKTATILKDTAVLMENGLI